MQAPRTCEGRLFAKRLGTGCAKHLKGNAHKLAQPEDRNETTARNLDADAV